MWFMVCGLWFIIQKKMGPSGGKARVLDAIYRWFPPARVQFPLETCLKVTMFALELIESQAHSPGLFSYPGCTRVAAFFFLSLPPLQVDRRPSSRGTSARYCA